MFFVSFYMSRTDFGVKLLIHDNIFYREENANSIQDKKGNLMKQFIFYKKRFDTNVAAIEFNFREKTGRCNCTSKNCFGIFTWGIFAFLRDIY